ncbi:hypothetical protein F5050DRAFT_918932 [Lentinula boryana]|uniref:Uncharacterized protein n=1 Tax=Lentinula boryana TaxID=40481 RepID=A0ABQ8Q130_9AGAR|nr:hypothetical protein F5050DRAFT_918932 [Lentinula boryana]
MMLRIVKLVWLSIYISWIGRSSLDEYHKRFKQASGDPSPGVAHLWLPCAKPNHPDKWMCRKRREAQDTTGMY